MKHLFTLSVLILSINAFADVKIKSQPSALEQDELKTFHDVLVELANSKFDGKDQSVEIEHSCTKTPMMKVICAVSIETEGGTLGAA